MAVHLLAYSIYYEPIHFMLKSQTSINKLHPCYLQPVSSFKTIHFIMERVNKKH